jgi:2-iminoacetate synthase ThiH
MLDNFVPLRSTRVVLGKATAKTALHFGTGELDLRLTDGGELTHSYSVESNNEAKMTKHEIIEMIRRAGFDPVEIDTVYDRVEKVGV